MLRRTPLRRSQKPLKRTALRRTSKRKQKGVTIDLLQIELDKQFYRKIWKTRPHFCFESGAYLGDEPRTYMFHHVLEKEKYPQYRYEPWNIVLLSWEKHSQVHINIDKTPKVKFKKEQLLKKIDQIKNPS